MKDMQRDYMFKVGNEIVGVGIFTNGDEVLLGEYWDDYESYVNALKDSEEFFDYVSWNGSSECDTYNKKEFIKRLKKYNKKGKFLGIIDYYSNNPHFIQINRV